MRKIKNYICGVLLLSAFMGYAQVNEYGGTPNQYGAFGSTPISSTGFTSQNGAYTSSSSTGSGTSSDPYNLNEVAVKGYKAPRMLGGYNSQNTTSYNNQMLTTLGKNYIVELSNTNNTNYYFALFNSEPSGVVDIELPADILYRDFMPNYMFVQLLKNLAKNGYDKIKTVAYAYRDGNGVTHIGHLTTISNHTSPPHELIYFKDLDDDNQYRMTGRNLGGVELYPSNTSTASYNAADFGTVITWDGTSTQQGINAPGSAWILDPNTQKYLIVTPSPPKPPTIQDPCTQVKAQVSNSNWLAKLNELRANTNLKKETGYMEQLYDTSPFKALPLGKDSHELSIKPIIGSLGYMHTHLNPFYETQPDGNVALLKPIPMHSPDDVKNFIDLLRKAYIDKRPLDKPYGVMASSKGTYELKFTGDQNSLKLMSDKFKIYTAEKLDEIYKEKIEKYGPEGGFLDFLQNILNIKDMELLKIDKNNIVSKITRNAKGKGIATPCN